MSWLSRWITQRSKKFVSLFLVGLGLSLVIVSCSISNAQNSDIEITLVSYVATKAAYQKIIPQFAREWKQQHHQTVKFNQSYGASTPQTRAVINGLDADVVALALALDTKKIEKAGLIQPGWENKAPNHAIATHSIPVLITRKDNPKQIKSWNDLTKSGIDVVITNPKTSGAARWTFLALWGSQTQTGGTADQALDFTKKVYRNVGVLSTNARQASDTFFNQDQGDVLINYENEVILAGLNGKKLPYLSPEINISIDNPIAVVDKNVDKHQNRACAEAFVKYLFTPNAQREFAKAGFRSIDPNIAQEFATQYPPIKTLFTVQDLGGWDQVQKQFFADGAIFDQIEGKRK